MRLSRKVIQERQRIGRALGLTDSEIKEVFPKLIQIEKRGRELSEDACNGKVSEAYFEHNLELIRKRLYKMLPECVSKEILLNTDPRGYFLKLPPEFVKDLKPDIPTDWGGFGIICPYEAGGAR